MKISPDNPTTVPAPGARPLGVSDPAEAADSIQQMFDAIAPTYDRANHLLSFGLDRTWWLRTARTLRPILQRPQAVVLDLCCGTGDLTLALYRHRPQAHPATNPGARSLGTATNPGARSLGTATNPGAPFVTASPSRVGSAATAPAPGAPFVTASPSRVGSAATAPAPGAPFVTASPSRVGSAATAPAPGAPFVTASPSRVGSAATESPAPILALDFSATMLALAEPKFRGRNIRTIEADALHLPFADSSIDLVTSAFGFRNLTSYPAGLAEIHRVLRPGGQLAILECNQPSGLVGWLYSFYFHRILPIAGGLISGKPRAYAYLPDSVMKFPRPPQMLALIAAAGFANPSWTSYTLGTAGLYRATKS